MAYANSTDIANRALQHLGRLRVNNLLLDVSQQALEVRFCYDKVRDAELRRNVWRFAIRRSVLRPIDNATVIWSPSNWNVATPYVLGAVVHYNNDHWQTDRNITGGPTPDIAFNWNRYFGPSTADPFVPAADVTASPVAPTVTQGAGGALGARTYYVTITYTTASGETIASSETQFAVSASNQATVASPAAATGVTGYNVYASTTPSTEGLQNASPIAIGVAWTEPTTGLIFGRGAPQNVAASYFAGELVVAGGTVYLSLINGNTDAPPTPNWLNVAGTTTPLQIVYPIGVGPVSNTLTMNAFRLPYGYLKRAPQDPKAGINPFLGAPRDLPEDDYLLEGNYIVSRVAEPIMLRYMADVIDVVEMDPMFCEGVAARIAAEVAPMLVDEKLLPVILANVNRHYDKEMWEARVANGIEVGTDAPPEDDFITCRY